MLETGQNGIHHLMVELYMLDDVGQAYDLASREDGRIAATLGRHTNDFMTSFYSRTPSGFLVEYGWGGRSIDPDSWKAVEMTDGPSLWGQPGELEDEPEAQEEPTPARAPPQRLAWSVSAGLQAAALWLRGWAGRRPLLTGVAVAP